ncbi:hypothetical protein CsatB_017188 [Cannabis sativa]|uniref:uncharacterized protein LOC133036037 n=1 Tax=Cannabis sativa TaxID=3483 RepID=UPI0029C9F73E|nr:uncharacterized protein LOC133036037 [Cannabis sativa]
MGYHVGVDHNGNGINDNDTNIDDANEDDKLERLQVAMGFDGLYSVDVRVHSGGVAMLWCNNDECLTTLYGEPNRAIRHKTWDLLRSLKSKSSLPWCIIGDLNYTTSRAEKRGGNRYLQVLVDGFNQALSDCDLVDMELIGYPYTWERGRGTDSWVEIHLDRALVCSNWFQRFRMAQLHNLEVSASDHCLMLLEPTVRSVTVPFHQFYFENAWLREPLCGQVVKDSWDLCEVTSRKKQNTITQLMNDVGHWVTWEDVLRNVMVDYFKNLFTSNVADYSTVVEEITSSITLDHNLSLLRLILEEEVRRALFSMC